MERERDCPGSYREVKGECVREEGSLGGDEAVEETVNQSKGGSEELGEEGRRDGQTGKGRAGCCPNTFLVPRTDFWILNENMS